MEVDYYSVLEVSKNSTKKEILDKYRILQRRAATDEIRDKLDRSLLVLRISYLKHVFDTRGERGLTEPRSLITIARGMAALAQVRARHYSRTLTVQRNIISSPQTHTLKNDVTNHFKSPQNHMDRTSTSIVRNKKSQRSVLNSPQSYRSRSPLSFRGQEKSPQSPNTTKYHTLHNKKSTRNFNSSPQKYSLRSVIVQPQKNITLSQNSWKSPQSYGSCTSKKSPQILNSKNDVDSKKLTKNHHQSPNHKTLSLKSYVSITNKSYLQSHVKLPKVHEDSPQISLADSSISESGTTSSSSSSNISSSTSFTSSKSTNKDTTSYKLKSMTSGSSKVKEWLDCAWKQGLLLPRASSSLKERYISKYSSRTRDKKPASAMELFPSFPSSIRATSSVDDELRYKTDVERDMSSKYRGHLTHRSYLPRDSSYYSNYYSQAEDRYRSERVPPRAILGDQYLSSHSKQHRETWSRHEHRYSIQRPLIHITRSTSTSTMRMLIHK